MKIRSNPKSPDEYLKMFNSYFKHYRKVLEVWKQMQGYIVGYVEKHGERLESDDVADYQTQFSKIINKRFGLDDSLLDAEIVSHYIKIFTRYVHKAMSFERNDRIEALLKHQRAVLAWEAYFAIISLPTTVTTLANEGYETLSHFVHVYYHNLRPLIEPLQNIFQTYKTKHEGAELLNHDQIIGLLKHYLDLYETNPDLYRELNDYSWAGKGLNVIHRELDQIERRIDQAYRRKNTDYDEKYADATPNELYLAINKNTAWYKLEENFCDFEAFIMSDDDDDDDDRIEGYSSHCGADGNATYLFSLRSEDDKGHFKGHITVSVRAWKVPEQSKYYGKIDEVYEVLQVKGKRNSRPKPKYWPAIMKLFLQPEFGWQRESDYKSDLDFKPIWIEDYFLFKNKKSNVWPLGGIKDLEKWESVVQKQLDTLAKKKAWWNDPAQGMSQHHVLIDDLVNYFSSHWPKAKVVVYEKADIGLQWDSYWDMLDSLKEWHDSFEEIVKSDEDYYPDVITNDDDIDVSHFLTLLEIKHKKFYKALVLMAEDHETSIEDFVRNYDETETLFTCMRDATQEGWDVGTRDSKSNAYKNHLKDLELVDRNENHFAIIKQLDELTEYGNGHSTNKWEVFFHFDELMQYYFYEGDVGHYDPSFRSGLYGVGTDWFFEWSHDYDSDVADERFYELLYEQDIIKEEKK